MDLSESVRVLAYLKGVPHDVTDPFSVMPEEVKFIDLEDEGKRVDVEKTVKLFFEAPSFICTDVRRFWELLLQDPKGYVIDVAKEFRTKIIYH